ncbi:FAD-binding monooxygenase [Ramlibacter sp. AW1]|uniref:FAD-binding monooxygenase n=1 Tax=Ramlibacter aurantiacus TaxID=2801330 RepID=A0A936ZIS1_9BURK|nr:FAD-binding monooxygenase [Ramlibacter aurantiacus]MBL0420602.1 FAD-binding monooxygenase [Ramlibacter aurantiacus]
MQFHLNGFRPGDPHVAPVATQAVPHTGALPAQVDVFIVGGGPAGLTLAAQLAAFPDIHTCVVEQKDGPMELGQADGIACRTMEMFEAFNFSERVLKEACWINEVTFWKPDEKQPENIVRHGRVQDTEDGLSEFPHVVLNQARVHDFYLDVMRHSPSRLEPHYSRRVLEVSVDRTADDYPVTVRLERTGEGHAGQVETVKARYVVGCDGARSNVRRSIGRQLVGDSANQAWGVMDVLAVTDFPDIRYKVAVQSANGGNLLVIPREGGYLFRLYVEMDKLGEEERVTNRNITIEQLIATAQRILHPYKLDVKEVPWWSVYEIGQRICDKYDDVPDGQVGRVDPRVFIAGDACHTHSPKAGQGMNFSMQDTFNLGWKLAAVLRGQCDPALLDTYSEERQPAAQQLIDFDREWAKMFSDKPKAGADGEGGGVDPKEFQRYFEQHGRFTAGMGTHYQPSIIRGEDTHQPLATGFVIGTRFHSAPVLRITDAKPMHLGHVHGADGRWRLYAFAGAKDLHDEQRGVRALCRFLSDSPDSPLTRFTRPGQDVDSVFDLRAIFQEGHRELSVDAMPALLFPRKGRYGLRDYEKVFSAQLKNGPDVFDLRGIDRGRGALVVVRPDQYVAHVLPLDAHQELARFFAGFMRPN